MKLRKFNDFKVVNEDSIPELDLDKLNLEGEEEEGLSYDDMVRSKYDKLDQLLGKKQIKENVDLDELEEIQQIQDLKEKPGKYTYGDYIIDYYSETEAFAILDKNGKVAVDPESGKKYQKLETPEDVKEALMKLGALK